jgi:hypothetical protein
MQTTALEEMAYFCDESTHLEHDGMPYLVLGALSCPVDQVGVFAQRLRTIKANHGCNSKSEIKWTRVAPANVGMYVEVVEVFFDATALNFRTVVAPKGSLNHELFGQTHDDWYYKMFYELLHPFLREQAANFVYLDYKDTQSRAKIGKLEEVLANKKRDFTRRFVKRVEAIRSHDSELLQLADVLIGAVNYANRKLTSSPAKLKVVSLVKARSRASLLVSTRQGARKFDVFHWRNRSMS